MKKLFWGFFFIYLNFTLNINQYSLNMIPDFVGYILLMQGARSLEEESRFFQGIRPFATGMALYTAILWLGTLFGVSSGDWLSQLLNLGAMILALYISWMLIQGVQEMERSKAADLNGARLFQRWKGMLIVQIAAKVVYLMANLANIAVFAGLSTGLAIVGLYLIVLYLGAWFRGAALWEILPKEPVTSTEEA